MRVNFYKGLDREFELFGIKGKWISIVLFGSGACVVFGLVSGMFIGNIFGIVLIVILIAVLFFGVVTVQSKVPSRQVGKFLCESRVGGWVVRRETLCRILLDDARYEEVKKAMKELQSRPSEN